MTSKRIPLLLAAASCVFQFTTRAANDIEPGKEYYSAIHTPRAIVIDGDVSEWSGVPLLADPKFSIPKGSGPAGTGQLVLFEEYAGGKWTGPDDQTSAVQVAYDADNVYFGFIVTDDYHENSANSAWNGDSVQLMIANADRNQQVALYNYALGGVEEALGDVIVMHEAGPATDPGCGCDTTAVVKRDSVKKKTIYEIKLPKAALGLTELTAGTRFGLGMAINDGDKDTPGQRGWGGLGAHSIVFGKTPGETALVTLAKQNDIEPGKEVYTANPAPKPVALDGNLTEWSGVPILADPKFYIPKGSGPAGNGQLVLFEEYAGGKWTGPDDQTSAVQVVYDADNVYFGFVVTDDYHENSANSAWNGDSIQLMIASGDQKQQVALYNYALGGVEEALGDVIVMHEAGPATDPGCGCDTTAVITRNSVTKKTTYEIKLPKAALGLDKLAYGTQFGLGMAINDGDKDTPGQRGWGGLGAHSIVFGKTPGETALVTLGVGGTAADLIFLSAVSPLTSGFVFRVNNLGGSICDPATAKLYIDGVQVALTSTPKTDAFDFAYATAAPYPPSSEHTYAIEVKDTRGNIVADAGTFKTAYYAVLTTPMQATNVDKSKAGFRWSVFQNETFVTPPDNPTSQANTLADAELALAGQLKDPITGQVLDNNVEAAAMGPALAAGVKAGAVYRFEIPTVINLSDAAGTTDLGNFIADNGFPDDQMPGVPGVTGLTDGIEAEIITFVDLPAGWVKMGVSSDDGFRAQAGYINVLADAMLLGQFDGPHGTADTVFDVFVKDAGIYPIRVVYQEINGGASLELFTFKADGTTKVLVNDVAGGGLKAYRSGTAPNKPSAPPEFTKIQKNTGGSVTIEWKNGGTLQSSTAIKGAAWQNVAGASSPYTVTPAQTTFWRLTQ